MIVRFEFHGGCRDGTVVSGEIQRPPAERRSAAYRYWFLTNGARMGARFCEPISNDARMAAQKQFADAVSEALKSGKDVPKGKYPPDYHVYKVTDLWSDEREIIVRVEFVHAAPPASGPAEVERQPLFWVPKTMDDLRALLVNWEDAFLDWWTYALLRIEPLPGVARGKPRPSSAEVQRKVRIIDAMTPAERSHPSTLIDQIARERIALDAGATPAEVEQLVAVYEKCTALAETSCADSWEEWERSRQAFEVLRTLLTSPKDNP